MFFGEVVCLLVWQWEERQTRLKSSKNLQSSPSRVASSGSDMEAPLIDGASDSASDSAPEKPPAVKKPMWLFLAPAFCDLLGTTLGGIGLL